MKIRIVIGILLAIIQSETASALFEVGPGPIPPSSFSSAGGLYTVNIGDGVNLIGEASSPFAPIQHYLWDIGADYSIDFTTQNPSLNLSWDFISSVSDGQVGSKIYLDLDWIDNLGNTRNDTLAFVSISSITIIPEPSSYAVLLSGVFAFYVTIRRKQRA